MMNAFVATFVFAGVLGFGVASAAPAQDTSAQNTSAQNTGANAPSVSRQPDDGQPTPQARQESFDGVTPYEAFGYRLTINAAAPVSYTGSAYHNDLSGQSESNSDASLDESIRGGSPDRIDAW